MTNCRRLPVLLFSTLAACTAPPHGDPEQSGPSADSIAVPCHNALLVSQISRCIDNREKSPKACLEAARGERRLCDDDHDDLDDDFEDALAQSYSLAFAFGGGRNNGAESAFPGNVDTFVQNSLLLYSPGGVSASLPAALTGYKVVDESPSLARLADTNYRFNGVDYLARDPSKEQGSNYWLCQKKAFDPARYGGPITDNERLASLDLSINLPGGVESYAVVHPSQRGSAQGGVSRYIFVATMLFYPYNKVPLDNHEGDWEGAGVILDAEDPAGSVTVAYFDRHPSTDSRQLLPLSPDVPARDPGMDGVTPLQCGAPEPGSVGVRFWDFDGARHHVVVYVFRRTRRICVPRTDENLGDRVRGRAPRSG